MKFYVYTDSFIIITDDYTKDEIIARKHLKHIRDDLKLYGHDRHVKVYDENKHLVAEL